MVFYQWNNTWRDQPWQLNISVWTSSTFRETNPHFDNYRSWIDLIFASQPNLEIDFSKHLSLDENCHYQIIYNKFDLKIFDPPQYEGTVLHYQQANTELIKDLLKVLIRKTLFQTVIQISKYLCWLKLFSILWVTSYRMKLCWLMTGIHPGLQAN